LVIYRNPAFAGVWRVPHRPTAVAWCDDGMPALHLLDHGGTRSVVRLVVSTISDTSGRPVLHLGRAERPSHDLVVELGRAVSLIRARMAEIDGPGAAVDERLAQRLEGLSVREREILDLILGGNRVSTVAARLYLSENTIRNYLKRIYHKLDVHSLGELRERLGAARTGPGG
jgi:DNA-binding CsgD family transcriptional regulator